MSNQFKFDRYRTEDSYGYVVMVGHARLGKVHRYNSVSWNAQYDHGDGWKTAGTYRSRDEAAAALLARHEQRWGPIGGDGSKTDGKILRLARGGDLTAGRLELTPQERYAVVDGKDLIQLANAIREAQARGRAVRFTVHEGLKWDAGNGWTPSKGRPADETGH